MILQKSLYYADLVPSYYWYLIIKTSTKTGVMDAENLALLSQ